MKKLFGRFFFTVVKIKDKDIDGVIIKLHEEITGPGATAERFDYIGCKLAESSCDHSDVALRIFYENKEEYQL